MLDAYIIEEIKKREERQDDARRPRLQIEIDPRRRDREKPPRDDRDIDGEPEEPEEDRPTEDEEPIPISIRMSPRPLTAK